MLGVDDGINFVAYADWLLGDDLMRAYTLNRGVAASYFGDDGVVVVGVEPSAVADLAAGFGVERSVIEDDFAFVSGFELLCAMAVVDDGENFAVVGASLAVALELRFRKLLVGGVGGLLGWRLSRMRVRVHAVPPWRDRSPSDQTLFPGRAQRLA